MSDMKALYLLVPLAPLAGAILAGLFGRQIGRAGAHVVTILGVAIAFVASLFIYQDVAAGNTFNGTVYTWMQAGGIDFQTNAVLNAAGGGTMVYGGVLSGAGNLTVSNSGTMFTGASLTAETTMPAAPSFAEKAVLPPALAVEA